MVDYNIPYMNMERFKLDTIRNDAKIIPVKFARAADLVNAFDKSKRVPIMETAMNRARNIKNYADITMRQLDFKDKEVTGRLIEVYRLLSLFALPCAVFYRRATRLNYP